MALFVGFASLRLSQSWVVELGTEARIADKKHTIILYGIDHSVYMCMFHMHVPYELVVQYACKADTTVSTHDNEKGCSIYSCLSLLYRDFHQIC